MSGRVVITGIGVVSSIGTGKSAFWEALTAGRSGIGPVEAFDTSDYEVHVGGEIRDFDPALYMTPREIRHTARASQFAIAAAELALEDALCETQRETSVIVGTTMGEGGMIEQIDRHWTDRGEDDVWALTVSRYPGNALADNLSRHLGCTGHSRVIPAACSAGNYSIGFAYDLIRSGLTRNALAGGSDPFSRIAFTGFNRLFSMAPERCRPFDRDRKGMLLGEGSAILFLEDLDAARSRGAQIYAEIAGYGLSCDAYSMTIPSPDGIESVMNKALRHAGISPGDVDYICAHGTGTPANDKAEFDAVRRVFGQRASELPVSSIKSMLGHTMGAASAMEAAACALAIHEGIVPPTINHETPDPECRVDCVPNEARRLDVRVALNNSLAFGGNNACLALKRYEEQV